MCHPTLFPPAAGTTNFVHRFPFSCVSIGLTIGKRPVVGVVYNPILNELYHAGVLLCALWPLPWLYLGGDACSPILNELYHAGVLLRMLCPLMLLYATLWCLHFAAVRSV